jgi:hypothetical protein
MRARLVALGLAAVAVAGCSVLVETPPPPTPADFQGIAGDMLQHGIEVDHVVSGDAGCDDPTLRQTAIALDAKGLDQATSTRVYVYIFRNRDVFERLRQTVDTCARAYVTDPSAYESLEVSPFVVAGPGPWAPDFRSAIRAAVTEAAGTGD